MNDQLYIGIDAGPMLQVTHGLGRYLRAFLMPLASTPGIRLMLVAHKDLAEALVRRFVNTPIHVIEQGEARRDRLDAVWYPWNSITFPCDAPALLTLHHLDVYETPSKNFLEHQQAKYNLSKNVRKAAIILALSEYSKEAIADTLDVADDAIVVAPPLPDASWAPGYQELKRDYLGEMPFVLVIAGWQAHHNLSAVIEAWAKVNKKRELRLLIVGPLTASQQQQLARIPYASHMDQMLDDNELRSLYRNALAVAHPAEQSHWSSVAAEALACGAAFFAPASAGMPEIVRRYGMLIDLEKANGWTSLFDEVITDDELLAELRLQAQTHWGKRPRDTSLALLRTQLVGVATGTIA